MLMNRIHNFSHKWRDIGLGLGFFPSELDQISCNPSLFMSTSAPTSYMTRLLSQWVQWPTENHPTRPTLRALCEALRSAIVGLGSLAEELEREVMCSATAGKGSLVCTAIMSDHKTLMYEPHPVYDVKYAYAMVFEVGLGLACH